MEVTELTEDEAPDLLGDGEIIECTVDTLDNVIKDEKIRTKHKFGSFFAESFTNVELLRFEYDQDSIVVVPPAATFTLNRKKQRSRPVADDSNKPNNDLLADLGNFEQRKVRTRSGRHSPAQQPSQTTSDDDQAAPSKRIRVSSRSSARVTSPLVRFGSAPSTPAAAAVTANDAKDAKTRRQPSRSSSTKEIKQQSNTSKLDNMPKVRKRNNSGKQQQQQQHSGNTSNDENSAKNELKKDSKKSKPLKGVTGLKNMGNTCYLNTIVQVLASLKCFRMALSEVETAMNQQIAAQRKSDNNSSGSNQRDDSPKRQNHSRRKRNVASLTKSLRKLVNELQSGSKRTIEPSYFVQGMSVI